MALTKKALKAHKLAKYLINYSGFAFSTPQYSEKASDKYVTFHNYVSDPKIRKHIYGNTILALKRYKHTKIYCIDIDNHNDNQALTNKSLNTVIRFLGSPFFIEKSSVNGGYHIYYKFEDYLKEGVWKEFQDYLNTRYEVNIETIYGHKALRLPFSKQYSIYLTAKRHSLFRTTRASAVKSFQKAKPLKIPSVLKQLEHKEIIEGALPLETNKILTLKKDLSYTAGERSNTQFRIAIRAVREGKSFDEYTTECIQLDRGSEDMRKWSQAQIHEDLKAKYDKALDIIGTTSVRQEDKGFYKNTFRFTAVEKRNYRVVLSHFYGKGKGKNVNKNRFINDAITFLEVIYGLKEYREKALIKYKEAEFDFLNEGVPVAQSLRKQIAEQYSLKNVEKIHNFLRTFKLYKTVKDPNGFDYSYKLRKWAKHWIMNPLKSLIKFVRRVTQESLDLINEIKRHFQFNGKVYRFSEMTLYTYGLKPKWVSSCFNES